MNFGAGFTVVARDGGHVWIIDLDDGGLSITNDAERVCQLLVNSFGNVVVYYRDTLGSWDQLVHDDGIFRNFKPGRPPPRELLEPGP